MKKTPDTFSGYHEFIAELKQRVIQARTSAGRAVNRELIALYWDIGAGIVEKQKSAGWGDAVVERIAADLRAAFPDMQGFSVQNIWRMRSLVLTHTSTDFLSQLVREMKKQGADAKNPQILSQLVRELVESVPWGHHVNLLAKMKGAAERLYYLRATARYGWSRAVLLNQIKAGAYGRAVLEKKTHTVQKSEANVRATMEKLVETGFLEPYGTGRGRTYTLSATLYRKAGKKAEYIRQAGFAPIQQEQMVLKFIQAHGQIKRADVMDLCHLDRNQAYRLLTRMKEAGQIKQIGEHKGAVYERG